jgi:hypothetical protein
MTYDELINTVSEIIENDNIIKNGLTLIYELPEKQHIKINQEIFYKMNPINTGFQSNDIFEVEIAGILIKFIKK